jgi:putative phage-type endonuclease
METAKLTHTDWIKARMQGIGGSEAATVLGLNPWETPLQLYLRKTSNEEPEDKDNEAMYWGRVLEDPIAKAWAERQPEGTQVRKRNAILQHDTVPCMLANLDRTVTFPGGERHLLEVKTAGAWASSKFGPSGSDEIPSNYLCQVMHYLAVTGYDVAHLACLITGQELRTYRIERFEPFIQTLEQRLEAFWQMVQDRTPPPPTLASDVQLLWPKDSGEFIEVNPKDISMFDQRKALNDQMTELKRERQVLDDKIKMMIGCEGGVCMDGQRMASYSSGSRTSLKSSLVKAHDPELWEKCAQKSEFRTLRYHGDWK